MKDLSAILAEIRQQFVADLPTRLDEVEHHILTLSAPNFDTVFDEIYRSVHSLKGSAGTHGLFIISTIAHHFENALTRLDEQYRNDKSLATRPLLKYIDLSRQAVMQIENGDEDFANIEAQLDALGHSDHTTKLRILLLETSQLFISMIEQSLRDYSVSLAICTDGLSALQQLLLDRFDLLVATAEAPLLNGRALIAALKLSRTASVTPSLLLASQPFSSLRREIDPDYVVLKDKDFAEHFTDAISEIIRLKQRQAD